MTCISQSRRAEIIAAIEKKQAQLAIVQATYERALAQENESYTFDSGEGRQQAKFRGLDKIADQIDRLESQIAALQRKLSGTGVVNVNLRRKTYGTIRQY
jgi:hypothetical protein